MNICVWMFHHHHINNGLFCFDYEIRKGSKRIFYMSGEKEIKYKKEIEGNKEEMMKLYIRCLSSALMEGKKEKSNIDWLLI